MKYPKTFEIYYLLSGFECKVSIGQKIPQLYTRLRKLDIQSFKKKRLDLQTYLMTLKMCKSDALSDIKILLPEK